MYKTILTTFLLLTTILVQAQSSFHVSNNYASKQGTIDRELAPTVVLRNLTDKMLDMRWEVKNSNLSQGWQAVVCDHQCYTTLVDKKSFILKPGEVLQDFKVSFRPNGKEGMGTIVVLIYEANDRDETEQSITFSAAAHSTLASFNTLSKESNAPKIYPNPAIEYIHLKDDFNSVKLIEIYNVVGRKMQKISVNHSNEKFDISRLPMGIYMVRMLAANGNIVRTQRISKYNP